MDISDGHGFRGGVEEQSTVQADIVHIREWLLKQPHLIARTDDEWILRFLKSCKFRLARTKEKLETYYTLRTSIPELFKNRDPFRSELQDILNKGLLLPIRDSNGPVIMLIRGDYADPSKNAATNVMKVFLMIVDVMFDNYDPYFTYGDVSVVDLQRLNITYITQFTPMFIRNGIMCLKGCPVSHKAIHLLNMNSTLETVANLVVRLLGKKLGERVHVHSNSKADIFKLIPRNLCPKEYGGEGKTMNELTEEWKKKVEDYRDWFLENEKYGTDESKRVGFMKQSDLFGTDGTFKSLQVD
uniref:CRAL-TRIO domain-containing protein n=1 Tax=Photinus pyralis TaxID=7054 RepID=A0A1Y1NFY5_PHOPY